MTYEGLNGNTRREVGRFMGFPSNDQVFRLGFQASIPDQSEKSSASYANLVTVEDAAKINNEFAQSMVNNFKANPFRHPFNKRPRIAQSSINKWVAGRSNNKIKDLLPQGAVSSDTKVVLVNVIHFKDDWRTKLDLLPTPMDFKLANGRVNQVEMMFGDVDAGYDELPQSRAQVVAIPFEDNTHDMIIVLPSENSDVNEVINELKSNPNLLNNKIVNSGNLETVKIALTMPKFEIEKRLKLKELLAGNPRSPLRSIFSERGDFSRMAENSEGFKIDEIHHKAVIEVNEDGVEATGATGIAISVKGFFPSELDVVVDRPFLFFLVDKVRNNILFAGRIEDP